MQHGGEQRGAGNRFDMEMPEGMQPPEGMQKPDMKNRPEWPEGMQKPDFRERPEDMPLGWLQPKGGFGGPRGMDISSETATSKFYLSSESTGFTSVTAE